MRLIVSVLVGVTVGTGSSGYGNFFAVKCVYKDDVVIDLFMDLKRRPKDDHAIIRNGMEIFQNLKETRVIDEASCSGIESKVSSFLADQCIYEDVLDQKRFISTDIFTVNCCCSSKRLQFGVFYVYPGMPTRLLAERIGFKAKWSLAQLVDNMGIPINTHYSDYEYTWAFSIDRLGLSTGLNMKELVVDEGRSFVCRISPMPKTSIQFSSRLFKLISSQMKAVGSTQLLLHLNGSPHEPLRIQLRFTFGILTYPTEMLNFMARISSRMASIEENSALKDHEIVMGDLILWHADIEFSTKGFRVFNEAVTETQVVEFPSWAMRSVHAQKQAVTKGTLYPGAHIEVVGPCVATMALVVFGFLFWLKRTESLL